MSVVETLIRVCEFQRGRTLATLNEIAEREDADDVLGWRPGPGRAHIAWQMMHIGVTEEIFATQRLSPEKKRAFEDIWPRFQGGSTPDDDIPSIDSIREVLDAGREHLWETLRSFDPSQLDEVAFVSRFNKEFTLHETIQLIVWHEAHHQGQAHITFNLFKAQAAR